MSAPPSARFRVCGKFLFQLVAQIIQPVQFSLFFVQPVQLIASLAAQQVKQGFWIIQSSRFAQWFHRDYESLNIAATYNLVFNASLMVEAGLGCALTYEGLVNTAERELCFRPVAPRLEDELYLVWKKFQVFSRASERFLTAVRLDYNAE